MPKPGYKKRTVSEREKAILTAYVFDETIDFELAYKLAREGSYKELLSLDKRQLAQRWINQERIKKYIKQQKTKLDAILDEKAKKLLEDEEWRKNQIGQIDEETGYVDFTDRQTFINYLSHLANTTTDEVLRKDILKMISDNLQFKTNAFDKNEDDIQRFYTPLHCRECKLYQKQKNQEPKE